MIRMMSHNQWKHDKNSPKWIEMGLDCSAYERTKGFARVYNELKPDIVGCQEVSKLMSDELLKNVKEYGIEYQMIYGKDIPIYYNNKKLELVENCYELYPENCPNFEGIFNNDETKGWTLAVFRVRENNKMFIFVSTHLWWKSNDPKISYYQPYSNEAREYQISIVIEKIDEYIKKYHCPAIIVGDFNEGYNSMAVRYALNHGFVHAHDVAKFADETEGYHECGPEGFSNEVSRGFVEAIDHIMIKNLDEKSIERFCRYTPEYYLPLSDHSPVYVDVDL